MEFFEINNFGRTLLEINNLLQVGSDWLASLRLSLNILLYHNVHYEPEIHNKGMSTGGY